MNFQVLYIILLQLSGIFQLTPFISQSFFFVRSAERKSHKLSRGRNIDRTNAFVFQHFAHGIIKRIDFYF